MTSANVGIGYDGSELSNKALTKAATLFNSPESKFFVYIVYSDVPSDVPFGYTEAEAEEANLDSKNKCEEMAKDVESKLKALGVVTYTTRVESGDPRNVICMFEFFR